MRFELVNEVSRGEATWKVDFYFGPSKSFERVRADQDTLPSLQQLDLWKAISLEFNRGRKGLANLLDDCDADSLQLSWNGRAQGTGPFEVCDALGDWAERIKRRLEGLEETALAEALFSFITDPGNGSRRKLIQNGASILSGLAVAAWFNTNPVLAPREERIGAMQMVWSA